MKVERRSPIRENKGWLITLAAFLLVAVLAWVGISTTGERVTDAQADVLREALYSAAVNSYAITGRYPTLNEIKSDYGVAIDDEKFNVIYDMFASNIMPRISVEMRKADEK